MDTRRSDSWSAGASVFSGRPDPVWALPESQALRLDALWRALDDASGAAPTPPPLGYRGCFAEAPEGARRYTAYRGAVSRAEPASAAPETRADPQRAFERFVLGSATDAVLREQLLELAGLASAQPPPA